MMLTYMKSDIAPKKRANRISFVREIFVGFERSWFALVFALLVMAGRYFSHG